MPWRSKWQPAPVFLPGRSHGQRSLAGCSPGATKDWATRQQQIRGILKSGTGELIYKTEIDSQTQKTNLWLPKRKREGRNKLGVWVLHIHTTILYTNYITNKGLLYHIGDYTQYLVITYNGKNTKKNRFLYMYNNHFALHLKLTTL